MKIGKRIVIPGILGLVAGAMFLVWGARYLALARYQKQLLAAGEKLKLEDHVPPPPAPGENGASVLVQTMGAWRRGSTNQLLLDRNPPVAMRMVAPGKAMAGWAQPDVRDYDGTNFWNEVKAALAADGEVLDLVRAAATFPTIDFHLNYQQGFSLPLPHLAELKRAEQRLTAAMLCDLRDRDTAAASTNLQAMLGLAKATANERLAISQLVRHAMASLCFAATWEFLQSPGVSDSQLETIQQDWADLKFVEPAEASLEMERALGRMMAERMRNSHAEFRQVLGSWGFGNRVVSSYSFGQSGDAIVGEIVDGAKEAQWRVFLSYPDELRALRGYQVLLESFRLVQVGQSLGVALAHQNAGLAEAGLQSTNDESGFYMGLDEPDLRHLLSSAIISLDRVINRVFCAEVTRELSVTAVALKRHQLRHGQYPGTLPALVPEFLSAIPVDPADGQPLRYRLEPDGTYLLYSVGENGVDDGGDASPTDNSGSISWQKGRDLVWPRPASAEEVTSWQEGRSSKHGR
jgi:hypothetical protein